MKHVKLFEEIYSNDDSYSDTVIFDGKELKYQVHYDWDLGMHGEWEFPEISFNGEDIREYDLGFSDNDIKDIEKMIVKKIKKETRRSYGD